MIFKRKFNFSIALGLFLLSSSAAFAMHGEGEYKTPYGSSQPSHSVGIPVSASTAACDANVPNLGSVDEDAPRASMCSKVMNGLSRGLSACFSGIKHCTGRVCKKLPGCGFIMAKTALDLTTVVTALSQMDKTQDFRDTLGDVNCNNNALCESNVRDLVKYGRSSYWSNAIMTVGFSCVAVAADVAALGMYILDSEDRLFESRAVIPLGISAVSSGVDLLGAFIGNGYLWSSKINHLDKIPDFAADALQAAIVKGPAVLVPSFISGLPGLGFICWAGAQSRH